MLKNERCGCMRRVGGVFWSELYLVSDRVFDCLYPGWDPWFGPIYRPVVDHTQGAINPRKLCGVYR
jgi:hypothetical protein